MNKKLQELKNKMETEKGVVVSSKAQPFFETDLNAVLTQLEKYRKDIKLETQICEFEQVNETELDDEDINFEKQNVGLEQKVDVLFCLCVDGKKIPVALKTIDHDTFFYDLKQNVTSQNFLKSVKIDLLSHTNKAYHTNKGEKTLKQLFVTSFHSAHTACIFLPKLNRVLWEVVDENIKVNHTQKIEQEQQQILAEIQKHKQNIVDTNKQIAEEQQKIKSLNDNIRKEKDIINSLKKQSKNLEKDELKF